MKFNAGSNPQWRFVNTEFAALCLVDERRAQMAIDPLLELRRGASEDEDENSLAVIGIPD
jgi:hypothetical protein